MAATTVTLTVTVSDGDATMALTDTATQNVTVNPMPVAPAFTNIAMFGTAIEAEGKPDRSRRRQFLRAPGTAPVSLTLGGTDMALFTLDSATGTLTFNDAPDFEMPRGAPVTGTNTNDYALTVTAMNSVDSVASGAIIVRVTDANDAPVFPSFTPPAFEEYTEATFDITATDEDSPAQTLSYSFVGPNHGATITDGGTFTWTPGEDDGTVARTFSVTVTDDGGPPTMSASTTFDITAAELAQSRPDRRHHRRRHDAHRPEPHHADGVRDRPRHRRHGDLRLGRHHRRWRHHRPPDGREHDLYAAGPDGRCRRPHD